ncbi:alpha-tocopherol transfer protein-like isoform X1 [Diabrotica virgifera virgifera]|uniref:CRAL-TRIO domain-containing protein n=1 Tax=Diabrotica virgifera virgifera TaxID=50390 RepID=A0ABM5JX37_DIAVI|nr:alpha-tocopherol transfer protein-like isoform X1 [Diabrotica virgifera virgifera]
MNPEKRKALMLSHFGKTNKDLEEDVKLIKEWLKTQPHLPEIPSDHIIASFICMNKFSLERTKQGIDLYYTTRSTLPCIYQFANPKTEFMKIAEESSYLLVFPKMVDDRYLVTFMKLKDCIPNYFDPYGWAAQGINIIDVILREDDNLVLGLIIVVDNQNFKMEHVLRLTPTVVRDTLVIIEKLLNSRIKEIHFLNCPSYVDLLLKVCKQFLKPKLYERIRIHKSTDTLLDYIPAEVLPSDYGGKEKSVEELQKDWKAKLAEYQEVFDQRDGLKVNESLRPTPLENAEAYGVQGTFKNLSVD